jgi:AcrR family transcriptional regulator
MKKEKRREQLIKHAIEVFVKNGYKGATTARIAEEAGVSEVTLFRYFSSKKEIFLAGVKPIFIENLHASMESSKEESNQERIRKLLMERLAFMAKNHELIKLILHEKELLVEYLGEDLFSTITRSFKEFLESMDMEEEKQPMMLRLIMGSILSFLYLPEAKESEVKNYVDQLVKIIDLSF